MLTAHKRPRLVLDPSLVEGLALLVQHGKLRIVLACPCRLARAVPTARSVSPDAGCLHARGAATGGALCLNMGPDNPNVEFREGGGRRK